MRIKFYPESDTVEDSKISRFFKDLSKNDPALWNLVKETLTKAERSSNLDDLKKQGWVEKLKHTNVPIREFRIPPKKRKAGVARLYFGYKKNDKNIIYILSAEKKHGKSEADNEKIKQAQKRYKEVCE